MAASRNDSYLLSQDTTFQNRVRMSMCYYSVTVMIEAWSVPFHRERQTFASQVLNSPDTYKQLFSNLASVEPTCISDATAAGTVTITAGNVAAQAALVTDAHIDAAINTYYNSFFRTPA